MPNPTEDKGLDVVLDVKVKVTVQLGSCQLPMRNVLELAAGSVVQLHQHASDPVGLYVNDKLVAYGEVVVVGGGMAGGQSKRFHTKSAISPQPSSPRR